MPNLATHNTCSGCAACYSVCRKGAISMKIDDEGFARPFVNEQLCIDCGICEKVCHVLHPYESRQPIEVYAARGEDDIRLRCSSGGIFSLLAESVVEQGGVVWGVAWDMQDNIPKAKFTCVDNKKDLEQFRGSKYVQAEIGDTFKEVTSQIKKGTRVLFSGTPCQIAGLKHILHNEYKNLVCVEVICHGVPSPEVFKNYLNEVTKNNTNNIYSINFRAKQLSGYGWRNFGVVIDKFSSNESSTHILSQSNADNVFIKAFLSELCNRPSCHNCYSRKLRSGADITIGDFWKLSEYLPKMDDDFGTSLVLLNTKNGCNLFNCIESNVTIKEQITYDIAIDSTAALIESPPMHPKRKIFFKEYKNCGIEKTVIKLLRPSIWKRIWFGLLDIQYYIKHKFY